MTTRREYLVNQGLAQNSRGRFSREAQAALARARDSGMTFSDDPDQKPSKTKPTVPDDDALPVPEPYVPKPIQSLPKVRDITYMLGYTVQGWGVKQDTCQRCAHHVSRCACPDGIHPSKVIVKWGGESKKYGVPLDESVSV